jgi:hypothetical protein
MGYIKHEIDNFEYNKTYNLQSEHKWDSLKEDGKEEEYFEERYKDCAFPNITTVQYDIEKTGQIGTML